MKAKTLERVNTYSLVNKKIKITKDSNKTKK